MTSPIGSGCTQRGYETKDDPKSAAWLWFEVRQRYRLYSLPEDTEGGFAQDGWTQPYWHDDIGAHFFETMNQTGALLLGRKTWQGHAGAFDPMPEGDLFGDVMNTMPKYVVSTTLTDTSAWRNSILIKGNVVEEVRALKAQDGKNIGIDGSSVLVHTLVQHDLVDEYSLLVYPLVLGGGKKLFPDGVHLNLR